MRRYVGRVQLCRDGQVLDRLFKIATFLNEFVPESVTTEKALWVFGDHLSERIKIHTVLLVIAGHMIALGRRREPARSVWFIWSIWSIWLVSFNRSHETDRIDRIDQTDQINKTGWRTFSAS